MKTLTILTITLIVVSLYLFLTPQGNCILKGGQPIDEIVSYEPCDNPIECKDHISRGTYCYMEDETT